MEWLWRGGMLALGFGVVYGLLFDAMDVLKTSLGALAGVGLSRINFSRLISRSKGSETNRSVVPFEPPRPPDRA